MFQLTVAVAAIVPLAAGGAGVLLGPEMIGRGVAATPDLDSHFRYLSGLLLGIGIAFLATLPKIERRVTLFRTLGLVVVAGGLARLLGASENGLPGRRTGWRW